jgi:hypothetical protein
VSDKVKRQTVSEFIRESKPDWEHVKTREERSSTGAYSGPLQVHMALPTSRQSAKLMPAESFADQAEAQRRQIDGEEESVALWGEETVKVEDPRRKTASGLPTGD